MKETKKDQIQIHLLGRFEVIVGDRRIDQLLRKSTKGWTLIKYLLLHMGEEVPSYELFDVLWPNEGSTNPESALKTQISRIRAFLTKCSPELADCILTRQGAYLWNPDVACRVDVAEFEQVCKEAAGISKLRDSNRPVFERMLSLYAGDLLPANAQEPWVVTRSIALHNLYVTMVYHYLDLLKARELHEDVVRVCRLALEMDAFDERLHVDLMEALVKTRRNNEAMLQYKHASNLHLQYLGVQPPDGITAFYRRSQQIEQRIEEDIDGVREELLTYDQQKGAFLCEYSVFKEIYHLQMRNLERLGTSMFLGLILVSNVDGTPMDPMTLDEVMRSMQQAMKESLRKGDTIARYSAGQYALLLPNVNYETGRMVMERIKSAFYRKHPNSSIACNYHLVPLQEAQMPFAARAEKAKKQKTPSS